jgi:hypothetical protein
MKYLGAYRLVGVAVFGIEGLVVAVSAASLTFGTVPIRAGKPGIYGYFLNFAGEMLLQEGSKIII